MYPGEEPFEPPHHHHHHLPKVDDDDDDHHDNHHNNGYDDPHQIPYPPPSGEVVHHHQPPPPATPQQPLQPPKPLFSPHSRPPSKKRPTPTATPPPPQPPPPQMSTPPPQQPLQPPQPIFLPTSPPPKSRPPPPYHHRDDNQYEDGNNRRQQLFAVITTILVLLGLAALIIWLLYRPSKPHFTAVSAALYALNATSPPPYVTASLQITVLNRNPSKRTSIYYDNLIVAVHYRNYPITPPASLPPLHHLKGSTVMMSPVIGGGPPVAVPPEVAEGLVADEAYGVVGLSWVLVGRVKYRGGWFRSGHNRVYIRCDVIVAFKNRGGGGGGNPSVPLLRNPPCFVDM